MTDAEFRVMVGDVEPLNGIPTLDDYTTAFAELEAKERACRPVAAPQPVSQLYTSPRASAIYQAPKVASYHKPKPPDSPAAIPLNFASLQTVAYARNPYVVHPQWRPVVGGPDPPMPMNRICERCSDGPAFLWAQSMRVLCQKCAEATHDGTDR